jgi:hypothetical protein
MTLQVIGAGMGRTGTLSLKMALEQLGLGPCYHMEEVFAHPEHRELWVQAGQGKPNWDSVFEGYQSTVDFPSTTHWRELIDYYPAAKVILSVRDAQQWFESTQASIFRPDLISAFKNSPGLEFAELNIYTMFDGNMHERDHLIEVFNRHIEAVKNAVPAERLLVFQASQGWQPLCEFLQVPVPATAYPRSNAVAATSAFLDDMLAGKNPTRLPRSAGAE